MKSLLLIGPSNMAGRGELGSVAEIENEHIFMMRKNQWMLMKEPIHCDKDMAGIGLSASFAYEFVKKYNEPFGLIPCAVGGTRLAQWAASGELYSAAVKCARSAQLTSDIIGILWHQGESDSAAFETAAIYEKNFMIMINALLADLKLKNIPVIVGELGEYLNNTGKYPFKNAVNDALHKIARDNNFIGIASSAGLKDKGDGLHFDAQSLRSLGVRYFEIFDSYYTKLLY